MIYHIALLTVKTNVSETEINRVFHVLSLIHESTPGAKEFSFGPDCSIEGLNRGHTYGLLMSFDSLDARDSYLKSEAHQQWFENDLLPIVEGELTEMATTFDFIDNHQK